MDAIQVYVDYVQNLRDQKPDLEMVEQKFDLSAYHPKLFGTTDYCCYFKNTGTLHVVDYKHGAGVPVEVEENEQLMYYGVGAIHANRLPLKNLVLTIVQPRCWHKDGPIRSWSTDIFTIVEYVDELVKNALNTERPNAPLKTGEHCRWCSAQGVCPQMSQKSLLAAQSVFSPSYYDPEKLSETLKILDQVEAWAKSVRSFAYQEAEAGRIPPGFKLVDKRASRKWREGISGVDFAMSFPEITSSEFFEMKMKTVAQVEKMLPKHLRSELESLSVKESSGKNLVQVDDDRPEVLSRTREVFEKIT
jgi:hypothetical protein